MRVRREIGAALALLFAVGFTACGGDADDTVTPDENAGSPSSTSATPEDQADPEDPGSGKADSVKDDSELAGLDYTTALIRPEQLRAAHPDDFPERTFSTVSVSDESTHGPGETGLRPLCNGEGPSGSAAAGSFVEYKADPATFLFNTSLDAFAGDEAAAALDTARQQVDSCSIKQTDNAVYVPHGAIWQDALRAEFGDDDDRVVLTMQNPKTLVTISDLMVRDGQFVYELRVVNDEDAPGALNDFQVSKIMITGVTQFREWIAAVG